MKREHHHFHRMLSLDPTSRGFGYAILEIPDLLIDWGVCQVRTDKKERVLRKVAALIHRFAPDIVVVENIHQERCRRGPRVRDLIESIVSLARAMDVAVGRVAMRDVRDHFAEAHAKNKDAIAKQIAGQFPELDPILPPRRRLWMPEDERMAVFDAISMATVMVEGAGPTA